MKIFSLSWKYVKNYTIWKNKYCPAPQILWAFRPAPNPSTLGEASVFVHFGVDPKGLNYITPAHLLPRRSRFWTRRRKSSKNRFKEYRWPEIGPLFGVQVLSLFFRKSTKRWRQLDFWGVKNAWKSDENYAFWPAPRTIRGPWTGFSTGAKKTCKVTPKCI